MNNTQATRPRSRWPRLLAIAATLGLLIGAAVTYGTWGPSVIASVNRILASQRGQPDQGDDHGDESGHGHSGHSHDHDDHGHSHDHDHDHEHEESEIVELSSAARSNLGLTGDGIIRVQPGTFERTMVIPAIIAARPGRTMLNVSTPLTGVVEHVHAAVGEAVVPGTLLFKIRLTHEDLVQAQVNFLETLGELDVERQEVQRLSSAARSGAVPGRTLLEKEYAVERLTARLSAQRESLKLHGFSDAQVARIEQERRLLRELHIRAPSPDKHDHSVEFAVGGEDMSGDDSASPTDSQQWSADARPLTVAELNAHKGEAVSAGESLCRLADLGDLYIEGTAFERDADAVYQVMERNWDITALIDTGNESRRIDGLKILFLDHEVDPNSRALRFYLPFPNEIVSDVVNDDGRRFVAWRYRPGQRLQLQVPVERIEGEIVLPVDAVAKDGIETFVFVYEGGHFIRHAVNVKYRDQSTVVIARDGDVHMGDRVAARGAHQLLMALKNQSGGGADPHAGHTH